MERKSGGLIHFSALFFNRPKPWLIYSKVAFFKACFRKKKDDGDAFSLVTGVLFLVVEDAENVRFGCACK